MSITTLKRKTNSMYAKVHSHGRDGENGFSLCGARRGLGYIGKDQKVSKVFTPFKGIHPMGLNGSAGRIVMGVGAGTNIRAHQFQTVKRTVVDSREKLNRERWCCADIVRTQSGIDLGSADSYTVRKSAANDCVALSNKPYPVFNSDCKKASGRLDCANNYSKDVVPIDSSVRTHLLQKQCALLAIDPSKLMVSTGTSNISHFGC
jgi:hypothetical protein